VGICERRPIPTLRGFATTDFLPHITASFQAKPNTATYYQQGVKKLLACPSLAEKALNEITTEHIGTFIRQRQAAELEISSIHRELQVLRRMFALAQEWGKVDKALPKVTMLPEEKHRERVLTTEEERLYLRAAPSPAMQQHADPLLAYDVATILVNWALRPEECFRLTWQNIRRVFPLLREAGISNPRPSRSSTFGHAKVTQRVKTNGMSNRSRCTRSGTRA
jgi:site-specific recombinase XerD